MAASLLRVSFKSSHTSCCCSFCPVHKWKTRSEKFKPGKHSVFSPTKKKQTSQPATESQSSPEKSPPQKDEVESCTDDT